ncbi:MAG: hypothetical protein ABJZ55_02630 [Fuerstiella sp.]
MTTFRIQHAFLVAAILLMNVAGNACPQQDEKSTHKRQLHESEAAPKQRQTDAKIKAELLKILEANPKPKVNSRTTINVWSRRADSLFFLERFSEAVKEYEQMIAIDPELKESHWRLGIAYFFNNEPNKAVQIFEGYHSFDDVDRENGIWRFLSQFKATNPKTAGQELLKYAKDDREPFPDVYRLFEGNMTIEQVIDSIPSNLSAKETEQRSFYVRLYCGMLCVVKKQNSEAIKHLDRAVQYQWPQTAGYGPNYMWHVARIQLNQLKNNSK